MVTRVPWIVPTTRAVRPSLYAIVALTAAVVAASVVVDLRGVALPLEHVLLVVAGLAVAIATPHDPAANLLAALPTGATRRLAQRTAITAVVGLGAWTVAREILVAGGTVPGVPALLALASVSIAASRRFDVWGGCVPLAIVPVGLVVDLPRPLDDVLLLWVTHPWPVLATGVVTAATLRRPR